VKDQDILLVDPERFAHLHRSIEELWSAAYVVAVLGRRARCVDFGWMAT
jgi:hypothetical protein